MELKTRLFYSLAFVGVFIVILLFLELSIFAKGNVPGMHQELLESVKPLKVRFALRQQTLLRA